ncbi:MAG TPA: NIPSNAP family protein, partial [Candidatus Acidoferrum sp.]|nr:NIPSNAP family protein [Candidatus Acidoferrum sp.]
MVTPQTSAEQWLKALKPSYVLSFLLGVTLIMLAFSKLGASNAQSPPHVYELRLYHAKEGKMNALKARFGDHTDSIFKRHNMKSIGYWSPEDAQNSQNLVIYILEHP